MQYQIYFHFPSSNSYLGVHDSEVTDNLHQLGDLISRLVSPDDQVSLYLPESNCRIEIELTEIGHYVVALDDGSRAGTVSRTIKANDPKPVIDEVEEIAADPRAPGWSFKYW